MSGLLGPLALIAVFVVLVAAIRLVHLRQERGELPDRTRLSSGRKESDSNND
ncbi:hypothetical protein [Amycolatopsis regifaucium]|uniref:hypothetical protein n=1 Tax=Amycolatopsis regifaucium TaxID=546365 RepID=UPI0008F63D3A|nr:hypothetical protein [Amycolatopsis regifaucium]SFJ63314.1 hypothetical protein SAMN04489731_12817 [Amycolatopsis regifaucium]